MCSAHWLLTRSTACKPQPGLATVRVTLALAHSAVADDRMRALLPDMAEAVIEPVTAWLSSADASDWQEPQSGPSASSQPEPQAETHPSQRAGAAPHRYEVQTYPWALRFRDRELERRFQIRRAAGESRLPR